MTQRMASPILALARALRGNRMRRGHYVASLRPHTDADFIELAERAVTHDVLIPESMHAIATALKACCACGEPTDVLVQSVPMCGACYQEAHDAAHQ